MGLRQLGAGLSDQLPWEPPFQGAGGHGRDHRDRERMSGRNGATSTRAPREMSCRDAAHRVNSELSAKYSIATCGGISDHAKKSRLFPT